MPLFDWTALDDELETDATADDAALLAMIAQADRQLQDLRAEARLRGLLVPETQPAPVESWTPVDVDLANVPF